VGSVQSRDSPAKPDLGRQSVARALYRLEYVLLEQLDECRVANRLPDELAAAATLDVAVVEDLAETPAPAVLAADVRDEPRLAKRAVPREEVRSAGQGRAGCHHLTIARRGASKTRLVP